jgi:hypothetical protein
MLDRLTIIDLGTGASASDTERLADRLGEVSMALPGVGSTHIGRTMPDALYGGQLIWRLSFSSERHHWDCIASDIWLREIKPMLDDAVIDVVASRPIRRHVAPRSDRGIWRCLVLAVEPGTSPSLIRRFEKDMLLMPGHVAAIGSWSFGRAMTSDGRRRWTHVWEQEFDSISGLQVDYMQHPVHWGFIDGWYDPESPTRIVDIVCIAHAATERQGAVII